MSALGPELIPEGITLAEALPHLFILAALFFALGAIQLVDGFVKALFWGAETGVSWVPVVGKLVKKPIHRIEQKVTNALGSAVNSLDGYIGHSFHQLGKLGRQLAREFEGLALDLYHLTAFVSGLLTLAQFRRYVGALLHPIRTVQAIERKLRQAETVALAKIRQVVLSNVYPRIGALEHDIAHVLEHDIASLRARTRTLEREALRDFRWLRKHERALAATAFAGAVAISLRRLRLGWLRCRNWRKIGPHVCGLPASLIEDLLGLELLFLVAVNPVKIAEAAIEAEHAMHSVIEKMVELGTD